MSDNTPAIKAFVEERIRGHLEHPVHTSVIDELELIVIFCDGLTKQNESLSAAYAEACSWECMHCGWRGKTKEANCPKYGQDALMEAEPDGNRTET